MPDGSPNLTVAFSYAATSEYVRMIREDLASQGAGIPGDANVVSGGNAGTIVNPLKIAIVHN